MGNLLLRSLGLLVLFQLLAASVLLAGPDRRCNRVALAWLAALVGLSIAARSIDPGLFLGGGVVASWLVRRSVRRGRDLWRTVVAGLVPMVLALGLGVVGSDPRRSWSELQTQVELMAGSGTVPSPSGSDPPPEERRLLEESRRMATAASQWAMRLLPAEIVTMAFVQVLLLVVAAGRVARRAGRNVAVLPVSHWRVPFASIWGLAIGLALIATRQPAAAIAGANLVLMVAAWLAVQGLAVLWAWLERGTTPTVRTLLVLFFALAAWPFLVSALALLGTADLWVDFRRLRPAADDS